MAPTQQPATAVPPSPAFVIGVSAAAGIHRDTDGDIAQLLIIHPGPRRAAETVEDIEANMRTLATSLCLGPGAEEPPMIGGRILIRDKLAALDYGHDQYVMTIPSPPVDWVRLVAAGLLCRICLVLAPLPLTATPAETDAHLRASHDRGQVMWGTTYARRRS
ncbi:hypothetical protein A8W25_28210 [Streptomyces sp. ERV7]|uniref:hypothetical protein n=1 Tax=Streptomyces sp. ERV7 TaxID=1322334 RepID=UPI0007F506ED|nr:hypothetical protein [Streptomyces sp. ERV7]OAR21929.1 hypothetical protein A8W25_28210 [Streptomyces sp. ERV7]